MGVTPGVSDFVVAAGFVGIGGAIVKSALPTAPLEVLGSGYALLVVTAGFLFLIPRAAEKVAKSANKNPEEHYCIYAKSRRVARSASKNPEEHYCIYAKSRNSRRGGIAFFAKFQCVDATPWTD